MPGGETGGVADRTPPRHPWAAWLGGGGGGDGGGNRPSTPAAQARGAEYIVFDRGGNSDRRYDEHDRVGWGGRMAAPTPPPPPPRAGGGGPGASRFEEAEPRVAGWPPERNYFF